MQEMINVTFRMNKEDKKNFERVIHSMGLNLSSAFNVFTKAVIAQSAIPFELKGYDMPNKETIKAIEYAKTHNDAEEVSIEQFIAERKEQKEKIKA